MTPHPLFIKPNKKRTFECIFKHGGGGVYDLFCQPGAIDMLWLRFWTAVRSAIFFYSQGVRHSQASLRPPVFS